ncbi:MAG: 4Fe-4S dicluster domain-containing protein [Planctomycetota bacterium]|jgi:NADH-quinone oxidoreductase subunit I
MMYAGAILRGFHSLLTGLGITGREIPGKSVTLTYPHEEPELSDAFRSVIQLVRFEETGSHDCIACMQCENICPSFCIKIEGGRIEGLKGKRATSFELDFALCSLCGLCIDTCPTDTLEYAKYYDEAGRERQWVYDLIEPHRSFEEQYREERRAIEAKEAAEKAAKKAAAAKAKAAKAKADEAKAGKDAGDAASGDADPAPEADA